MLVYHNCEINGDGAVNIFDATVRMIQSYNFISYWVIVGFLFTVHMLQVVGSRMFAIGITVRGICPDPLSKDKDDWFSFKPLDDGTIMCCKLIFSIYNFCLNLAFS
jgi:hypothetical protein